MLFLYIFFPLINFAYIWFIDLLLGKQRAVLISVHLYILLVLIGIIIYIKVCVSNTFYYITIASWINCGIFVVNWGFTLDTLSVCMLLMVGIISGCVHFYSMNYMANDPSLVRFISYLSLFTFFMFILVSADNFIQLFLGWEGIGLCSYLLISFWFTRIQANKSALKAILINRLGDFGFVCGFLLLFYIFRSADFSIIFTLTPYYKYTVFIIFGYSCNCLSMICIFLFIGSIGKSAQIGLHVWLPDAMEGPTPVSALIHAATLVTAGVYLIIRCSPIFEFASLTLVFIMIIGGITSFFAATIAIVQYDIKKIIAYSTCSQLGYMVFICGLSEYNVSLFHLINHAFFKALLFLTAGSIIHAMCGEQDLRQFGSLINILPYSYSMMLIGCFALAGIPFLSGFYSKDLILEMTIVNYSIKSIFIYWLGTISALLTAFYSCRLLYYTFWAKSMSFKYYIQVAHELPQSMGLSLYILAFGSVFIGYILKDPFVGVGSIFWGSSIFKSILYNTSMDIEFMPLYIKHIPIIFSFTGILLGMVLNLLLSYISTNNIDTNKLKIEYPLTYINIVWFLNNKWYFDFIYNYYIGYSCLKYSYNYFYKLLDKGFVEILMPHMVTIFCYKIALIFSKQQLSFIYQLNYLLVLGIFIFISIGLMF